MEKTLAKQSGLLKLKYKFFINRVFIYFSFLLIPLWLQYTQDINFLIQSIILIIYMLFMGGQWYLLGKELDHRLKIYYRVNSSMDRTLYRIFSGSIIMLLLFNIFAMFPDGVAYYLFWIFFVLLGLFYSWPTRGKIIEDSMASQFGEIKFLDSFEKTVFLLISLTFLISIPELPMFENVDALRIYFDPEEKVNSLIWNFLTILYFPFKNYPKLYNLIWSFHFYFFGIGFYLIAFYGILRHFFSRRLSILGVFSILSTWSFSRILNIDYFSAMSTTCVLMWVWAVLWSTRSGTYRSGFLSGLVCAYITMIDPINAIFFPLTLFSFYFYFLKKQTAWFRKQWLKYNILGGVIIVLVLFNKPLPGIDVDLSLSLMRTQLYDLIYRKAFFVISPIGLILSLYFLLNKKSSYLTFVSFDKEKFKEIAFCSLVILLVGTVIYPGLLKDFSLLWVLSFLALIPLEWIFQSISKLRSKRNMIYAMYILVCLLDSHLENRIRIIGRMFLNEENLKYLIQL